jgi:hypothetical protein
MTTAVLILKNEATKLKTKQVEAWDRLINTMSLKIIIPVGIIVFVSIILLQRGW